MFGGSADRLLQEDTRKEKKDGEVPRISERLQHQTLLVKPATKLADGGNIREDEALV